MSNNLIILNNNEFIVIPMKDIIGRTEEELGSVINLAFNPKRSLNEIKENIQENLNNNEQNKNNKPNNEVIDNDIKLDEPIQVREITKKAVKAKEIIGTKEAEKAENEAKKAADEAKKAADEAKKAADEAAKKLAEAKSAAEKAAAEAAKKSAEAAAKYATEKAAEAAAKATIYKAKKTAATQATIALNNAKSILSVKNQELITAEEYADSLEYLQNSDPNRIAALDLVDEKEALALAANKEVLEAKVTSNNAILEEKNAKIALEKADEEAAEAKAALN
ncbi:MAG: hypothetical protein ACJ0BU_08090 [Candidatus Puniceispirillales bacterium]